MMHEKFREWKAEIEFCNDPRIVWDWIKHKARQETISFSKQRARQRRDTIKIIETKLRKCDEAVAASPTRENIENLERVKLEYENEYNYIITGSIIRSRTTWYEKGERNTKYFLNLENNKKKKSSVRKLLRKNGKETTDPNTIADEIFSFYSDLYAEKADDTVDLSTCPFLNSAYIPKLSPEMRDTCEGELTYAECFNVLSSFKNNKTPGNDGLSVEFYKVFWPEIGRNLVDSLNFSYRHGELSTTQKEAVLITLIEKKNRDRRLIKNWRPISLVNVDVKIGSKAISKRLEKVLPHIIYYDQNAFVKGRTIFDAVRTINDVIDFTKLKSYRGILTAIDFEKAFDSLNWDFLLKSLETFGFGKSFIAWIKTFYNNTSSCVINNGFVTSSFQLKRGVRQGDPLSPFLFIIALETLAVNIRNNKQIKGISVDGNELKLTIFADDMTSFVRDRASFFVLMNTVKLFGRYAGLKMNHEKTEILPLGNMVLHPQDFGVEEIKDVVKILGVCFTNDHLLFDKRNFESIEKSVKEFLQDPSTLEEISNEVIWNNKYICIEVN
ncbi:hypothetical protein ACROYT_G023977 [Oculina patagonica]